jgi:hypothetical protein
MHHVGFYYTKKELDERMIYFRQNVVRCAMYKKLLLGVWGIISSSKFFITLC